MFEIIETQEERRKAIRDERGRHRTDARLLVSVRAELEGYMDQYPLRTFDDTVARVLLRLYLQSLARRLFEFNINPLADQSYAKARKTLDHPDTREIPPIRQKYLDWRTRRSDLV